LRRRSEDSSSAAAAMYTYITGPATDTN
jgi:hypothetical protein